MQMHILHDVNLSWRKSCSKWQEEKKVPASLWRKGSSWKACVVINRYHGQEDGKKEKKTYFSMCAWIWAVILYIPTWDQILLTHCCILMSRHALLQQSMFFAKCYRKWQAFRRNQKQVKEKPSDKCLRKGAVPDIQTSKDTDLGSRKARKVEVTLVREIKG